MHLKSLSASSFDCYSACQWQWTLKMLGFEDISGPAALLGTMAHRVLENLSKASMVKHTKDSKIWDTNYLWEIVFNRYFNSDPAVAEQIPQDKLRKVCRGLHDLISSEYSPIRDNTIDLE